MQHREMAVRDRRSNVRARIGRLTAEQLVEVERATMTFLGLAR
jgi:mRNA interferase MazF